MDVTLSGGGAAGHLGSPLGLLPLKRLKGAPSYTGSARVATNQPVKGVVVASSGVCRQLGKVIYFLGGVLPYQ